MTTTTPVNLGQVVPVPSPSVSEFDNPVFWTTNVMGLISLLTAFNVWHLTDGQTQTMVGFVGLMGSQIALAINNGLRKHGSQS